MKVVLALTAIGLFLGLVAPHYLGNRFSDAQIQLPQFIWTKSPPRIYDFSFKTIFRILGAVFLVVAIICFVRYHQTDGSQ